jgi:glycosyltransferase involved in cell wall biosynthesis
VFAFELCDELRRRGHEASTAYLYPHHGRSPLPLRPADVVLGDRPDHLTERLVGAQPALLAALRRRIEQVGPDVVQANGGRSLKYAALAARRGRRSWALVYRNIGEPGAWLRGWRTGLFYRHLVMPQVDGVVAVSEATRTGLAEVHRLDAPVVCIPRSVDVRGSAPAASPAEVRARRHTPTEAPVLVFVGSLTPEKRPDRLLRVFDEVRRRCPDAWLWVLGEGPAGSPLEARVAAEGTASQILLLGTREDVVDHLHAADLLLLTSDTEGVPGVVLEAAAVRRPAVATRVGGITECLLDGQTGLLADPRDEAGLADAVVALLTDRARRAAMGERARVLVAENFSLEAAGERYLAFYQSIRR